MFLSSMFLLALKTFHVEVSVHLLERPACHFRVDKEDEWDDQDVEAKEQKERAITDRLKEERCDLQSNFQN